jgi:L-ascorbate metabolism protein UlaG (beta-lactamase superfamily)
MLNITLRKKARQFTKLIRHSALTPRTGQPRKPVLARNGELALTFIGHSSFLVQIGGKNLVIDPNFARWLFILKRLRRPGVMIKDLPPIDAVLITHAHFDHLHRPSLRAIARSMRRRRRPAPTIIIPHLVADLVSDLGFREIIEMSWWDTLKFEGVTVSHTPSRHWGARVIKDMHRGYGGYVLKHQRDSVYHAGDTAYFNGFHEIGERLRPEVALLPIGAYNPPSFRNVHTSPEDAVRAFMDLGSRWMVPMHYGTFRLSHEPMDEPLKLLAQESQSAGVDDRVIVVEEGATQFF